MNKVRRYTYYIFILTTWICTATFASAQTRKDTLKLKNVNVFGKSKVQTLKESPLSVAAIDIKSQLGTIRNLADIINRQSGIRLRSEGGLGADFNLSLNGLGGNSIRYFIDGVPMNALGGSINLQNIPLNTVDRVEVYKGVVPGDLGSDALGGAVNVVTKRDKKEFLDVSVKGGSFSTWQAQVNARYTLPGTKLYIHPTFSYDYSLNNYMMKNVRVWDEEEEEYVKANRRRFHDRYENIQAQMEFGIEHTPWADQLSASATYVHTAKQIQTGAVQSKVYGDAHRNAHSWNVQTRWRKRNFLTEGLSANILLSHTFDYSTTVDTALRKYTWEGTWKPSSRNEMTGRMRMMRHYERPLTVVHTNMKYDLNPQHSISLNYMLTRNGNRRTDELMADYDFVPSNDVMAKNIISLTYNQNLFGGRMANTFFVKDYINHVSTEQHDMAWITHAPDEPTSSTKNHLGGGVGLRYRFAEPVSLKMSYERAVRLPLAREMLGNGYSTYANLRLQPEQSHNANMGLFGNVRSGNALITYEVGGFLRKVSDYIRLTVSEGEGYYQYDNVAKVNVSGIEGEVTFGYNDWLHMMVNCSYEKSVDKTELNSSGKPSVTYGNDIPNKPWLFGNAELSLTGRKLFCKSDRLVFTYRYQYVHWYYLTWKGLGSEASAGKIPSQNVHSASLNYSWNGGRYNISLDCDNIMDATLYDNYKLQKPGRSIMAGFRVYLAP